MMYWEEFDSKWGFSDGESVPIGAEMYRSVYIQVLNKLAENLDSGFRAVAYNRYGVHNPLLIVICPKASVAHLNLGELLTGVGEFEFPVTRKYDDAMDEAIAQALDLDIDDQVDTDVSVSDTFAAFINDLEVKD